MKALRGRVPGPVQGKPNPEALRSKQGSMAWVSYMVTPGFGREALGWQEPATPQGRLGKEIIGTVRHQTQ
jgi:hypothetical protein